MTKRLNVQYAILQVCYWGLVCVLCGGYGTVFLLAKGFTNTQAGIAIACANLLGVILQPILASIADASQKISLMKICALLTGLIMVGFLALLASNLLSGNSFVLVAILFVVTFAVISTLQGLNNAISLYYINRNVPMNFGLPRGIGSAGFACLSTSFGVLLEKYSVDVLLLIGLLLGLILAVDLCLFPVLKPGYVYSDGNELGVNARNESDHESDGKSDKQLQASGEKAETNLLVFLKRYPKFMAFLLGTMIMFTFHSMCNFYLINITEQVGGSSAQMGIAQGIAAVLELPVMGLSALLMKKFGAKKLLVFSAIFFVVKAAGYLVAGSVLGVYITQAMQMFAYAVFIPISVFYTNEQVAKEDMVKGQSLVVVALTIAGIIASLLGGALIDALGVTAFEMVELVFAIVGAAIVIFVVEKS